jgi:anaerobic selenocysteine-containing dehydrogenase
MMPTIHSTVCPLDCPDACALSVTVEDHRVTKIAAGDAHPITQGFICSKVSRFDRRLYHPDRLLHPMRRTGPKGDGTFERISWDDALGEITDRFRAMVEEFGGEAVLPYHYGGSNGILTDGYLDALYFARLGASRLHKTVCAAPTTEVALGMYGKMPGVAYGDYPKANCIVVWGQNPKASSIHLVPFLREAKRNGAFIAVIDPRQNFSSKEVDLHLPVRPGADLPLALAMIRCWIHGGRLDEAFLDAHAKGADALLARAEEWPLDRAADVSGVAAGDIECLAERYASSSPAVIRCGWGVERNRNGGQAVAAILAMPALLGKFGVPGGGYTMSNSGAVRARMDEALGDLRWDTRRINMSQLGAALNGGVDPPIKGLFVYNCNPVATVPHQNAVIRGLSREDLFTVVFDQVHTDSAPYADIVLPATTFLEHEDIRASYGTYAVGGVKPVIPPCGEARSNAEVFAALGRGMGWDDDAFGLEPGEYVSHVAPHLALPGGPADETVLLQGTVQRYSFEGGDPVQFETVVPRTPDGKVDLTPATLGANPYVFDHVANAEYPLTLISPASARMVTSTFGEFNCDELVATLHPEDADARGIADGDDVRVFNDLGEVVCRAEARPSVRPGVVSMPKGAWRKSSRNGFTSTALCPDHVNVVGGGACYNDARVEITKIE